MDTGEIHRDFHLATNRTIEYIFTTYGSSFLQELAQRTATRVYADIHERMCSGDPEALAEHLDYYIQREGGLIEIENSGENHILSVLSCPMITHINSSPESLSPHMETFLRHLYQAFAIDSCYSITLEAFDPVGSYRIEISKKELSDDPE